VHIGLTIDFVFEDVVSRPKEHLDVHRLDNWADRLETIVAKDKSIWRRTLYTQHVARTLSA